MGQKEGQQVWQEGGEEMQVSQEVFRDHHIRDVTPVLLYHSFCCCFKGPTTDTTSGERYFYFILSVNGQSDFPYNLLN